MSHNYPYRQPPSDSDLRPDPGPYSSSDRRHASSDHAFYRAPQESSSCYPSSSSSRGAQWSQDGALNILNSCGLEPGDLALLAELPEDVLTVESLPHVLNQIKGKRGTIKPFPPNALSSSASSSYTPSSARRPAVGPSTSDWDHHRSQPVPGYLVQYPLDKVTPSPLPFEQDLDRWGNPRTNSAVRADPPSSSSSSYMVDFNHRPGPSEYGKTGREAGRVSSQDLNHRPGPSQYGKTGREAGRVSSQDLNHRPGPSEYGKTGRHAGPVPSQDRPSFSSAERGKDSRSCRFSQPGPADPRSAPPPEEHHPKTRGGRRESETSSIRSSSRPAASMPSKKEAKDFHGTSPPVFPYSCSLCDITVMSEKVWIKHINGTQHADGQLNLLQRFPNWDCRLETISRADSQSEKWKDEGKPGRQPQTANQNSKSQSNKKTQKKASEKGKVVCVKFPAQSVDETYLRKLIEPFGKIVKILMFPSLAFVELGSVDQAKDLVKFHVNYPPTVNGEQMEFRISNTFSFLQSSRVVSFSPAPTGENGQSDLFSIIKRFGPPLYTLFLPSMAFVEMKNTPDAQKLVDYYSSNTLRINSDFIRVSFSGEYKSLMRVASAKRYEEESCSTKRTRSSSRDKEDKATETKRRKSSKDREKEEEGEKSSRDRRTRTRSRSREKSTKEKTARSRSREKSTKEKTTRSSSREKSTKEKTTRSRSREKSTKEKTARSRSRDISSKDRRARTRSKSREKSREKSSRQKRSRSRDKSSRDGRARTRSRSREKSVVPEKTETTDTESRTDPDPAPAGDSRPQAEEKEQTEEEAESSAEESDIEGMEVIGEDGENVEDADVEEEKEEEDSCPAERTDSPEEGKEEEVKDGEADDQEQQEERGTEREEEPEEEEEEEEESNREAEETSETQLEDDEEGPDFPVDLENCITLDELGEDQSDDQDEVRDERQRPSTRVVYFRNLPLHFYTDTEFINLVKDCGTAVRYFRVHRRREGFIEMSTSSEALRAVKELTRKPVAFSASKLLVQISNKYSRLANGWAVQSAKGEEKRSERRNRDEPNRKSEGRKESASKKTPEKESASRNSPEKKSSAKKTPEMQSAAKNTSEKTSGTTPERESANKKAAEKESANKKAPEKESANQKAPEKESASKKAPEKESANKKAAEKESTSKKAAEKESASKKAAEKESASKKAAEKESASKKAPEKESASKKAPEKESASKKAPEKESTSKKAADKESTNKKAAEKESTNKKAAEKESAETEPVPETSQDNKTLKRKGTDENDSAPEKKDRKKKESASDEAQRQQEAAEAPEEEKLEVHEKETSEPGLKDSGKSPDQPDSTGDSPKPQTEQKPDDRLQDSEAQGEQLCGPAGGAAEPQDPTKPVGTEFVRPVVGYFCNLCQLIYADEDEAKLQHCSSLTHYRKYQEKTGKDPWAS
ncbi:matrin 3-like 1.1 isoform X5 [Siniperca chuatsi]|uniref:matrin 3-like 1.1 isoform X5 n=1 Tax=Siniperca chuatsi TaxID=119488 RepID=UPI001CE0F17B|nr:matrin 3-like 1.1 isoform X5 [Siniperca chuatsi]